MTVSLHWAQADIYLTLEVVWFSKAILSPYGLCDEMPMREIHKYGIRSNNKRSVCGAQTAEHRRCKWCNALTKTVKRVNTEVIYSLINFRLNSRVCTLCTHSAHKAFHSCCVRTNGIRNGMGQAVTCTWQITRKRWQLFSNEICQFCLSRSRLDVRDTFLFHLLLYKNAVHFKAIH